MSSKRAVQFLTNLQNECINSTKWKKVQEKYKEELPIPVKPREIQINNRMKRNWARYCGTFIEFSGDYYRDYRTDAHDKPTKKYLKPTMYHELVHAWLSDNNKSLSHGLKLWKSVCFDLKLLDWGDKTWKWRHICPCGHWLKTHDKRKFIRCNCGKTAVIKGIYDDLKKIDKLVSNQTKKFLNINFDKYVILKIEELF